MKKYAGSLASLLLMALLVESTEAIAIKYKSDEFDDLLEGVITNNHKPKDEEKAKGPVDTMVQEALDQAKADERAAAAEVVKEKKPLSQEEQWKQLMEQPDPLQDQDIYAGEREQEKPEEKPANPEDLEMDDDISDLLNKSFDKEKKRSSFVNNIPSILTQKKQENYNQMFSGITEKDINSMEI